MSVIAPMGGVPAASRLWSPMPEVAAAPSAAPVATPPGGFSELLSGAIDKVSTNVTNADSMVRSLTLDDTIPVHQVTFALEQARLSMELMLQVRGRMLEAYQQLMNMQL